MLIFKRISGCFAGFEDKQPLVEAVQACLRCPGRLDRGGAVVLPAVFEEIFQCARNGSFLANRCHCKGSGQRVHCPHEFAGDFLVRAGDQAVYEFFHFCEIAPDFRNHHFLQFQVLFGRFLR